MNILKQDNNIIIPQSSNFYQLTTTALSTALGGCITQTSLWIYNETLWKE